MRARNSRENVDEELQAYTAANWVSADEVDPTGVNQRRFQGENRVTLAEIPKGVRGVARAETGVVHPHYRVPWRIPKLCTQPQRDPNHAMRLMIPVSQYARKSIPTGHQLISGEKRNVSIDGVYRECREGGRVRCRWPNSGRNTGRPPLEKHAMPDPLPRHGLLLSRPAQAPSSPPRWPRRRLQSWISPWRLARDEMELIQPA